jgi:tetratricopeptide (TPR) repeat protein
VVASFADKERGVADVAETLRNARRRHRGCTLLVGAGCSVSAGIPTARDMATEAETLYSRACSRVQDKDYPHIMAALSPDERHEIVARYVDSAKVNWAHLCIAQLVGEGYVDRILTTNFDPLVIRAAALLGPLPAVYDLASSRIDAERIQSPALVYLHGQRSGFVTLHTSDQLRRHAQNVRPVINEAGTTRPWIVIGYSGTNDGVFDGLLGLRGFHSSLYWVLHDREEPSAQVKTRLLGTRDYAFWVGGFDADSFFVSLLRELECFPPQFIGRPFTYLLDLIQTLAPYAPLGQTAPDFTAGTRDVIGQAVEAFEFGREADDNRAAQDLLFAGKLDDLNRFAQSRRVPSENVKETQAWGYVLAGDAVVKETLKGPGQRYNGASELAGEMYAKAVALRPDFYQAYYNWANALASLADSRSGAAADGLFRKAYAKYRRALSLEPTNTAILDAWGAALARQAKKKTGSQASRLFTQACAKYEQAAVKKPDDHGAFYNWGAALLGKAQLKSGAASDGLFKLACAKYERALAIKPSDYRTLHNWGWALDMRASAKSGEEADALFEQACAKYAMALAAKPDAVHTLCSWGLALASQARRQPDPSVTDEMFAEAYAKYEQALALKPDDYESLQALAATLSEQAMSLMRRSGGLDPQTRTMAASLFAQANAKNRQAARIQPDNPHLFAIWGVSLMDRAQVESRGRRERLLRLAQEKFLMAERMPSGEGSASYHLACLSALQGRPAECRQRLDEAKRRGRLPSLRHLREDPELELVRDESWFAEFLS